MAKPDLRHTRVTADERRNGWDADSLRRYLDERADAQADVIDPAKRKRRPAEANHRYRPHRWRSA